MLDITTMRGKVDAGLWAALKAAGGRRALARKLGISHQAIAQWTKIPDQWIIRIEQKIGVDRRILRPDLYRVPSAVDFIQRLLPKLSNDEKRKLLEQLLGDLTPDKQ